MRSPNIDSALLGEPSIQKKMTAARGRAEEVVTLAPEYKAPRQKDKVGAGFLPADPSIATTFYDLLTPDPGGLGG
jgi:hypothetical protein